MKHYDSGEARFKINLDDNPTPPEYLSDGPTAVARNIATITYTTPNSQFTAHLTKTQIKQLHDMLAEVMVDIIEMEGKDV